jgi:hypothetical protein
MECVTVIGFTLINFSLARRDELKAKRVCLGKFLPEDSDALDNDS